ncbi:SH3 domain-containing protein [Tieghemostelium lacteum]|uniref:SH3 domain-containing protein n=1 Tax=Tieghemostelium lacteum TaxID=361077 RepID=A0A152A3I9_TIELA|nr:SH3 domain-containing protein [Tieghemostelium lacteum]|eukprot:KYR00780.1 SH3 domain-containing protein [Tieghemostelium lacteum]
MSRGFSEDLWDKFESVVKKVDNGKVFTQTMSKFLLKQQQIESAYAKSLVKLCKDKSFAPDMEIGTLKDSFQTYREQLELIGQLHEDFSAKLEKIITNGLELYLEESRKQRKSLIASGEKLTKDLKTAEQNESKAKQNYERLKKKQEESHEELAKQPPGPKEQKARKNLESATKSADKGDNEYKDSVKILQQQQQKFYHEEMPKILGDLQKFESERIELSKDWLKDIIVQNEILPPQITIHNDNIKRSIEEIDKEKDIQSYILATMSGAQKPNEAQYEPYQPSNGHLSFTALSSPSLNISQGLDKPNARKSGEVLSHHDSNSSINSSNNKIRNSTSNNSLNGATSNGGAALINNQNLAQNGSNGASNGKQEPETVIGLYDYNATEETEISFKAKAVIKVLMRDESGWWQGTVVGGDGKVGMFPSNFIFSESEQKKKTQVVGGKCKVLYDYVSDCDGELAIKEGEILTIENEDEGWYFGTNEKGVSGRYPSNYCQILQE